MEACSVFKTESSPAVRGLGWDYYKMKKQWVRILESIGLGLGNSSCCAIQLVLNYLGIACAGFSVLDPLRPFCVAITSLILVKRFLSRHKGPWFLWYLAILLTLSAMPQAVQWWNSQKATEDGTVSVKFFVDQVRCDACASALKQGVLRALEGTVKSVAVIRDEKHRSRAIVEMEVKGDCGYWKDGDVLKDVVEGIRGKNFVFVSLLMAECG